MLVELVTVNDIPLAAILKGSRPSCSTRAFPACWAAAFPESG
jgi:hypothetical protein